MFMCFRMKSDEKAIQSITETVNSFINPWTHNQPQLVSLVSGVVASSPMQSDLLNAGVAGEESVSAFIQDRLHEDKQDFFAPIKATKLKTFDRSTHCRKISKQAAKASIQSCDRSLFARLLVISKARDIDLKSLMCYPLCPVSLPLATADGEICKTVKSALLTAIESDVDDRFLEIDLYQGNALVVDAMALVQSIPATAIPTSFGLLGDLLLKNLVAMAQRYHSSRVDFVGDRYFDMTIKGGERARRSGGANVTQLLTITSKDVKVPKQWKMFLSSGQNKEGLIQFLADYWETCEIPKNLKIFVTTGPLCKELTSSETGNRVIPIAELTSDHEEADTRLIAHAVHASKTYNLVVVNSPDTDVAVLCLGHFSLFPKLAFLTGTKTKRRILDMTKCAEVLGESMCKALVGLHAFSGCDSISSFSGKGKRTMYSLVKKHPDCLTAVQELGNSFEVSEGLIHKLETFVCRLYGVTDQNYVNEARYKLFCQTSGNEQAMPPCKDALIQHIKRSNYQAAIWKKAAMPLTNCPSPVGNGWQLEADDYKIVWNTCPIAPKDIISSAFCRCQSAKCKDKRCSCKVAGLLCTDLCHCSDCQNDIPIEGEVVFGNEEECL